MNYPDKFIIAYTGGANPDLLAPSIETADRFTQKDTSVSDWCDLLDEAIKDLSNPAYIWKRIRGRLLEAGVTPYELTVLEDEYVRGFESGPEKYKDIMQRKANKLGISRDAKDIIKSIVAGAISHLIFAAFR